MTLCRTYHLDAFRHRSLEQVRDVLLFAQRGIESVTVVGERCELVVEASDEATLGFVDDLISDFRTHDRRLRSKIVLESHPEREMNAIDVDAFIEASPDVYTLGEGLLALRGDVLRLFRFFEERFRAMAKRFDADENHYPVMLPIEIFEEIGYFANFPQHVTLCGHFPEDLPILDAVARSAAGNDGRLAPGFQREVAWAGHALKPAVCLPCYRQHWERVMANGSHFAVTMQNHVFRYEARNFRSLSRLWDFSVRDIVFFGSLERIGALRQEVMEASIELCRELGLEARVELANDPFFLNPSRSKRVYQRLHEAKYELLVSLPYRSEELAVSSFNLHRDFYTKVYNIRFENGAMAETACMGFGIERWVYGFLAQRGLDPDGWPEPVRRYVAEMRDGGRA